MTVFPTHVGMNRLPVGLVTSPSGIPHARGDEPARTRVVGSSAKYSPRTWG